MITEIKDFTRKTVGWVKNMSITLEGFECDEMVLEEVELKENEIINKED